MKKLASVLALLLMSMYTYSQLANTYYIMGNANVNVGNLEQAVKNYTKALEFDSTFVLAYFNRALTKWDLDDRKGALEDFSRVIELEPDNYKAHFNIGLLKVGFFDFSSIQDFSQAIALKPDHALAYHYRGSMRHLIMEKEGACADLEKALSLGYNESGKLIEEKCK